MKEPNLQNFGQKFYDFKKTEGIESDRGKMLEGLWLEEQARNIRQFEGEHPGISQEFDELIRLLPDADNPSKEEFPFAASVVRVTDGKIEVLARSLNMVRAHSDSTQHAELVALQEAQKKIGARHLEGCLILSTAQPCEMCAGAIRNTEVSTLVYGVSQEDLRGRHVQFLEGYKGIRTAPQSVDIDGALVEAGVRVVAGYKRQEVLARLERFVGTLKELYEDPDAKL